MIDKCIHRYSVSDNVGRGKELLSSEKGRSESKMELKEDDSQVNMLKAERRGSSHK
jgi:hypothetical protein